MQHKNYSDTVEMGVGTSIISTHGLTTLRSNIQGSITSLAPYQSDNDARGLSRAYNTLLTSVNTTITDLSGASPNTIVAQQSGLNSQMADLDQQKEIFFRKIKGVTIGDWLRFSSYIVGMVFGVIILTNSAPLEDDWKYKLLYAIWGAILYPLVLLHGVYDPPPWRALLIPIFPSNTKAWYMMYLNYFALFVYTPPNQAVTSVKNNSNTILRVFTFLVIAFWIAAQWVP
jgi:hypothetical protein